MATEFHNLSDYDPAQVPSADGKRFGIVVADWNENITSRLLHGAVGTLRAHGVPDDHITVMHVPGSFELTFGASRMIEHTDVDAVIVLGSVVRGDTPHFDYVCQGVTQGVTELNTRTDVPVIFGLLTTDNMRQAEMRAGGELGNKGTECAVCAIKMIDFVCRLKK